MKKFFAAACLLLFGYAGSTQAVNGTVKVSGSQQPAAVIELPFSTDIVSSAMEDYLSKKGRSRSTDIKGFSTYRNAQVSVDSNANADLYFRVERKSRQEKGATVLSLLLTAPKEGDAAASALHYLSMEEAKSYLNALVPAIEAYNLEQTIRDQNAVILKAENRQKDLVEDAADLEKKRIATEKRIEENKSALQKQEAEVALQKQRLASLVSLRKN